MKKSIAAAALSLIMAMPLLPFVAQDASAANSTDKPTMDADTQQRLSNIDHMVLDRMSSLNVPGYCLTVIKDGRVVFHKPYGFADFAKKQACTNDTVFGLASLTKTFTALTLLSLVDKGLVGLDDPLEKYIKGLTPNFKTLTIRQLASMTAGIPRQLSQEIEWKNQLEILDHTPLLSQPGSAFLYSNFSYRLLGSVIANVSKRDYFDVVKETVLKPLGMNSTATTPMFESSGRLAQAYGDNMGKGPLRIIEYKDPRVSFAAGMLATTSDDLVNYVLGLLSHKIISEKAYKTLWYERPPLSTGAPCPWAFGWGSGPNKNLGGKFTVAMNGGTPGVASSIIILPESNSAVIALCNLRKPPVYAIAKQAAKIAFGNEADADGEDNLPESVSSE